MNSTNPSPGPLFTTIFSVERLLDISFFSVLKDGTLKFIQKEDPVGSEASDLRGPQGAENHDYLTRKRLHQYETLQRRGAGRCE